MRLFAVGLSHRTAPVDLRECVDFARGGLDSALGALASQGVGREVVVLSTCNRAEIYAVGDTDATAEGVGRFFSEYHKLPHAAVAEHLYLRRGADAARHLFRVAAGLDSLVVGEPQILGQVKAAYSTASDLNYTGTLTNRLFHSAFAAGKRVRAETGLGEGAVSVSYAAIALAQKIFGAPEGAERAHPRRRRDGEAHRGPPAGAAGEGDRDREPDVRGRRRSGGAAGRSRPSRGRRSTRRWRTRTSSSPRPARRSRC